MGTTAISDRCTTLPDERTPQATAVALEHRGFSIELADDLDVAREDGTLVTAPASGSQLASYAWGAAYGQYCQGGKILEIHQELPGRIQIALIRQQVGC